MDQENESISLIIPTYNSERTIIKCLESVNKLRIPKSFELDVMLIDGMSIDETRSKILKHAKNKNNESIRYYLIDNPNRDAGSARNIGISLSNSYIAFTEVDFRHNLSLIS